MIDGRRSQSISSSSSIVGNADPNRFQPVDPNLVQPVDPNLVQPVDPNLSGTADSEPRVVRTNEITDIETLLMSSTDSTDSSSHSSDDVNFSDIRTDLDDDTPLYRGSRISVHESAFSLLRFCRTVNLNKRGVKHLLVTLQNLLPVPNKLARTLSGLLRQVGVLPSRRVNYHCCQCMAPLSSANDPFCSPGCSSYNYPRLPVHVGELYSANVEKQVKIVVESHKSLIDEYTRSKHILPCDIPNSRIFQQLPRVAGAKHITLLLQTDGAPLVKVGAKSLWPIQASIAEIPPPVRDYKSGVIVLGAWLGSTHPNRDLLWRKVVDQIKVRILLLSCRSEVRCERCSAVFRIVT